MSDDFVATLRTLGAGPNVSPHRDPGNARRRGGQAFSGWRVPCADRPRGAVHRAGGGVRASPAPAFDDARSPILNPASRRRRWSKPSWSPRALRPGWYVEHLADYIGGRELRNIEARWSELFPAYEAPDVSPPEQPAR